MKKYIYILLISTLVLSGPLSAQQKPDSLKQTELENRIKTLESYIQTLQDEQKKAQQANELEALLKEAEELSQKERQEKESINKKFQSGIRKQQGLNPNISLGGDFYSAYVTNDHPYITEASDLNYGYNRFELREMELGLESSLDPYTRGKSFISITAEGISIEEAYMEWLNLPLNMNLKVGKFYSEFGILNRFHDHALPQFDRPRVLLNQFGTGALGGIGFATDFMLPRMLWSDASSFNVSLINAGADITFASNFRQGPLATAMFKNYYDINESQYIEFRLSGSGGRNANPGTCYSYVGNFAIAYKWVPVGRAKYRSLDWKTEVQYSMIESLASNEKATGFYSSLVARTGARTLVAGRVGYSQLPWNPDEYEWDYTVNLDFWQSEFVFTRFQYQYNNRSLTAPGLAEVPSNHMFLVQISWAMGPHKHEAY